MTDPTPAVLPDGYPSGSTPAAAWAPYVVKDDTTGPSPARGTDDGLVELVDRAGAGAAGFGRRLVLFDPEIDAVRFVGRHRVRQTVLGMTPDDPGAAWPRRVDVPDGSGVFWGVLGVDGLTVALRARDFATSAAACRDAAALAAQAGLLQVHRVTDTDARLRSAWFSLDGQVALVAGQRWRRSARTTDEGLLRALRRTGGWGPLHRREVPRQRRGDGQTQG